MSKLIDLTGQKFGKLTVVSKAERLSHNTRWLCVCECGNSTITSSGNLKRGHTRSCGCVKKDSPNRSHGQSESRLYYVWRNMLNRCYNPKVSDYPNYGGRGIEVCDEWRDNFQSFFDWAMQNGYNENLKRGECTLDRKDTNLNYTPDNCRWTNEKTQQNNKRNNRYITYQGKTRTLSQWAEEKNIKVSTLHKRLYVLHWSIEKALNTP